MVPWERLVEIIQPCYPTGKRRRSPVGLERMPSARSSAPNGCASPFLQQCYGLGDEALEDTIYDSQAMRAFTGIDLGAESVPDATAEQTRC